MSTAYNGRIDAAQREGKNLKIAWTGGIYDLDYWVIPKGAPNKDAALKFIAVRQHARSAGRVREEHRLRPDQQEGARQLDAKMLANLPNVAGQREERAAVQT